MDVELIIKTSGVLAAAWATAAVLRTKATTDPDSQVREKAVAGLVLLGLHPSTPLRVATARK